MREMERNEKVKGKRRLVRQKSKEVNSSSVLEKAKTITAIRHSNQMLYKKIILSMWGVRQRLETVIQDAIEEIHV